MFDLQVLCFDCEVLDPTIVMDDERSALKIAHDHADECGHHLVIQRWRNGRAEQLWSVQPVRETDH
jgi:hypothetical protein